MLGRDRVPRAPSIPRVVRVPASSDLRVGRPTTFDARGDGRIALPTARSPLGGAPVDRPGFGAFGA
ncbi:hypothetical protein ACFQPA_11365 [Halomarina halobia]|uniref:Uncharacterized protein n=1 Tax=Halomarina halobia TaxID=3033386 RepID=A0ABD6AAX4_9EURY|nr:hypothetical protein [Halomarina sp. PSR21]